MVRGSAKGPPKRKGRKAPARRGPSQASTAKKAAKTAAKRAAKPVRSGRSSKASPAKDSKASKLAKELREAQARQAAASEILRIISQSPGDVQPVFDAIVLAAVRLLGCDRAHFLRCDATAFFPAAVAGPEGLLDATTTARVPIDPAANLPSRAILARRDTYLSDFSKIELPAFEKSARHLRGTNSSLLLPMLHEGQCIGLLALASKRANNFDDDGIALAKSFRDQALIAIENARLFNETKEALERQTATSEILKVIASSPSDVQPVFDAIAASAKRLLGSYTAVVTRVINGMVHLAASTADNEAAAQATWGLLPYPLASDRIHARVARTGQVVATVDIDAATHVPQDVKEFAKTVGWRSMLVVPMLRGGIAIGTIAITRREAGAFDDKTIDLLKTFADQAVIAIENSRLFNETQEALERQTATADILKVIASSPNDVQPVFEAIAQSARRVVGAYSATVTRVVGDQIRLAAFTSEVGWKTLVSMYPQSFSAPTVSGQVVRTGKVVMYADIETEGDETTREVGRARGFRSVLGVPMLRDDTAIGTINVTRTEAGIFDEHTIGLLKTFADQAVIAIENVRLFNETREALERQIATADILKVIASSPDDVQPVFEAIVASAARLIGGFSAGVFRFVDGAVHLAALTSIDIAENEATRVSFPGPIDEIFAVPQAGEVLMIADAEQYGNERLMKIARARGFRSVLYVPLRSSGISVGVIAVTRQVTGPFTAHHVDLLQTFADQAVIAIENVRLFNETQEALERQTATADILKVIASSPDNVQPVFEAIAQRSNRIVDGFSTAVVSIVDETAHLSAFTRTNPDADAALKSFFPMSLSATGWGQAVMRGDILQVTDTEVDITGQYSWREMARLRGWRSAMWVPLSRDGSTIGVIGVTRAEPGAFADHHVQLLQTFADQAVIAIENVRLFNETQEALERQTATADILKVIASSPDDVQPVFDAIAERANKLLGGHGATVLRIVGDVMELAAYTPVNVQSDAVLKGAFPIPIPGNPSFETVQRGEVAEISDTEADIHAHLPIRDIGRARGFRSRLLVPLKTDSGVIGAISVTRVEPGSFAEHHVQLLQTFADQAVIAIQNVRLFRETQEALAQQTATADVLRVIGSSVADTAPVFEKILDSCESLFATEQLGIFLLQPDGQVNVGAWRGAAFEAVTHTLPRPVEQSATGVVVRNRDVLHFPSFATAKDMPLTVQDLRDQIGDASMAWAPMLAEEHGVGSIAVLRQPPNPFSDKELALLKTFADQAVIAIQNTRLFNETKEALERQTATADILKVIAGSPDDVQPVFDAIAQRANKLVGGYTTTVLRLIDGNKIDLVAFTPTSEEADAILKTAFPIPITGNPQLEVIPRGEIGEITDTEAEQYARFPIRELARARGFRSRLLVPLKSENGVFGAISVARREPGPFAAHHVQLLQTFADQAVIAIQNVRLFNETKEALERQTATAEILKVIASSPSDVQPVFEAIVANAVRLISGGFSAGVYRFVDDDVHLVAITSLSPAGDELIRASFPRPIDNNFKITRAGGVVQIPDTEEQPVEVLKNLGRARGFRSILNVPLRGGDTSIGALVVSRKEPGLFAAHHVDLLQTFADQAVIAIENVRLFNETKEALERQTATADILKVIASSPDDVQPVFEAIVASAARLVGGFSAGVYRFVDGVVHLAAITSVSPAGDEVIRTNFPRPIGDDHFRMAQTGEVVHITDTENQPSERLKEVGRARGFRSILYVPLRSSGTSIGVIAVSRQSVGAFAAHHIELLQTFADQAVIAIENVRLFNETQEALERQTATSEVLEIISSSPGELDPVFRKMLENACRVCEANFGMMQLWDGETFRAPAAYNVPPALAALRKNIPIRPHPLSSLYAAAQTRRLVHMHDLREGEAYRAGVPNVVELANVGGARTIAIVPMLKEDRFLGAITIYRQEVRPFTDKQIALVENFTKQAVIAIENTRLLRELRERTDDLTRSLDDLRAAQDRLVQTEKLASLGQLTAGIAHEIKNPLNFVNNFSALSAELTDELNDILKDASLTGKMQDEVGELTKLLKANLEKVVQHGKRADSIVKNMLLHSREGAGEQRNADVNSLVEESLNLAYHGARAEKPGFNITLQRDFDASAGAAELFPQEITRALLNLISNGFYAASRRNGETGFEPTLLAATKNLGSSVEIRIRDNGTGIPPEVKEKMFNPFFTTKPAGEGTGLGLSMTHDIVVKQHGGRIDVATKPGEFTEFTIVLPRTGSPQPRKPSGSERG